MEKIDKNGGIFKKKSILKKVLNFFSFFNKSENFLEIFDFETYLNNFLFNKNLY